MFERLLTPKLADRRRSVLLLGPRQVGKSTLLRSLSPDFSINLARPRTYRDYVARPEKLADELRGAGSEVRTVFIDEIQKVPALLDLVQVVLDEQPRRFRFLLSGSSARPRPVAGPGNRFRSEGHRGQIPAYRTYPIRTTARSSERSTSIGTSRNRPMSSICVVE